MQFRGDVFMLVLKVLTVCMAFGCACAVRAQTITSAFLLTDPQQTQTYTHVVNINGTDFLKLGKATDSIQIYLAPSDGVASLAGEIVSDTLIEGRFTAAADYQVKSVIVAPTGKPALSLVVPDVTCKPNDIQVQYEMTPYDQVKNLFGNGLAKNYHVIQVSIVNNCAKKIVVPLGGVRIVPEWHSGTKGKSTYQPGAPTIAPFGLDHVMSIYNTDRTLTGSRALIFNIMQGATTLGSAIQPFFGPGFTQGVAIFGGAFRNAALEVSKDMSSQQLKSLSSETFNASETIGSNGSSPIQKFIFIPRTDVKLPSNKLQRIDDIIKLTVTWFVGSDTTQTQNATPITNPAKPTTAIQ